MFIRFDPRYDIYNRQVYSILPMLGDIGGLQQSLYLIGYMVVAYFSHRIFISSILKRIYQIKKSIQDNEKEKKEKAKKNNPV